MKSGRVSDLRQLLSLYRRMFLDIRGPYYRSKSLLTMINKLKLEIQTLEEVERNPIYN